MNDFRKMAAAAAFVSTSLGLAIGSPAHSQECWEVVWDGNPGTIQTQEEKIASMDQAFTDALIRAENCPQNQNQNQNNMKISGSENSQSTNSETRIEIASLPSNDVSGTETPLSPLEQLELEMEAGESDTSEIPEDVASLADNDSVLEAQIRRAAEAETDPEAKAKLWNEYRKYKGLPSQ